MKTFIVLLGALVVALYLLLGSCLGAIDLRREMRELGLD